VFKIAIKKSKASTDATNANKDPIFQGTQEKLIVLNANTQLKEIPTMTRG